MKILIQVVVIIIVILPNLHSQSTPIYAIEEKIRRGDKDALLEIAGFLDSEIEVTEFLGYHVINTTESAIARRIINENCLFAKLEIEIDENISTSKFEDFVNENYEAIYFEELAEAFLITPLNSRKIDVEFRSLSSSRRKVLSQKFDELLEANWVLDTEIDEMVKQKNPKCLLLIASELYKLRYRFNTYYGNKAEFIELLEYLIGSEIGVQDEKNELTWHIEETFYPDASLNLLIFFSKNFQNYKWSESNSCFQNSNIEIRELGREEYLFQFLPGNNDSLALDAFLKLTKCEPAIVTILANRYRKEGLGKNYSIPIFPYKFLEQLVLLTKYCEDNGFMIESRGRIRSQVEALKEAMPFKERRALEDSILTNLSIIEVTSFEYWALVYERSWGVTYSAGRILDKFYSNNWNSVIADEAQLELYFKKSILFDNLGIIGACNNYLIKFIGCGDECLKHLNEIQLEDIELMGQVEAAQKLCRESVEVYEDTSKVNVANFNSSINNLEDKLELIGLIENSEEKEDSIVGVMSRINYEQIGIALDWLEGIEFEKYEWNKYSFMRRDWGFFIDTDFDSLEIRSEFLNEYQKFNEYELYVEQLNKAGINIFKPDKSLDYDEIYQSLKYNIVLAFAGGGGGLDDNEVYCIIKILELTHNTTLGYPNKLCNSQGIYGCNTLDRAYEWRRYIKENDLLTEIYTEPVSFKYKN